MAELVGIQRCEDEKTWIAFPPQVIRQACIGHCGEEAMQDCWGEDGPKAGEFNECTSCYCEIVWTMPKQEIEYIEPEVVR